MLSCASCICLPEQPRECKQFLFSGISPNGDMEFLE
jgi:hypothetical protein